MKPLETFPRLFVLAGSLLLLTLPLATGPPPALASTADVLTIGVEPAEPTVCDSVTIGVAGVLSSSCYEIVSAEIFGPEPPNPLCMGPVCPWRFEIRITVRGPAPGTPCPAVIQPYRRAFPVGLLAAGAYSVRAVEVLVPSPSGLADSAGIDSSVVYALFFVRPTLTCPPGPGCYILGFGPSGPSGPLPGWCTVVAPPGGVACFDLLLHNEAPVAGVQTQIAIYPTRADLAPLGPVPAGMFTVKSVEAVGRAGDFQVGWSTDGFLVKVILYSGSGAILAPGDGPVIRFCYDVAPFVDEGVYLITHLEDVVADPEGNALPPCPTLRETSGRLCVVRPGCDVNGDGESNILDVIRIVRCALAGGGTEACPDSIAARADCNGDGALDVRDVICCVRKIVAIRLDSVGEIVPGLPSPGPGTSISFLGDVEWMTPVEGRVRIRFAPGPGTAGIEWMTQLNAQYAHARDLRIVSGGQGVHLEWSAGDAGIAYAMLYSESGAPVGHDVVLELAVDRVLGSGGPASLHITDPLAAGSDGASEPVRSEKASAVMPSTEVRAPAVYPARPNPFVAESEITFALPQAAKAELRIYDVSGRLVRTLVNERRAAGVYHERWDGRSEDGSAVASGVYLLRFRAGGVAETQRLLRLR